MEYFIALITLSALGYAWIVRHAHYPDNQQHAWWTYVQEAALREMLEGLVTAPGRWQDTNKDHVSGSYHSNTPDSVR